jgi:Fur family ferric uptake transcriptional regulator
MQKELIIEKLKEKGFRITKQRVLLLDIILEEKCACCKEIYYEAARQDNSIGMATVYRMLHTLEEIGALNRNSQFGLSECGECECSHDCQLEFEDGTVLILPAKKWREVVKSGLEQCGYGQGKNIKSVKEKISQ